MANAITKFKNYTDQLDEVYKYASVTNVLDGDMTLVKEGANANQIVIPKMSLDGLGNYSRSTGYQKIFGRGQAETGAIYICEP